MATYQKHVEADRRLVILRLLSEAHGFDLNSSIIQDALAEFGHRPSRDLLHTELLWLQEQGLLITREVTSVLVAELTQRGEDVAKGRASVPGVKRPAPSQ